MSRNSIVLVSVFASFVGVVALAAEDAKPDSTEKYPALRKLTAEQANVDVKLSPKAKDKFKTGCCVVLTGLIPRQDTFQINDFKLERQEFSARPDDPEKGDWKAVDIRDSVDVIMYAEGALTEPLPKPLTNGVVTEPLPGLKTGEWPAAVIHPSLRDSLDDPPHDVIHFRYLDFSVKPEHFYRYRIQIVYQDTVTGKLILKPGEATVSRSKWSTPTNLMKIEPPRQK